MQEGKQSGIDCFDHGGSEGGGGDELCTPCTSIIPLVAPTCCAAGLLAPPNPKGEKSRGKKRAANDFEMEGFTSLGGRGGGGGGGWRGPCMSAVTQVARTETHLPELSRPGAANFFSLVN